MTHNTETEKVIRRIDIEPVWKNMGGHFEQGFGTAYYQMMTAETEEEADDAWKRNDAHRALLDDILAVYGAMRDYIKGHNNDFVEQVEEARKAYARGD